VAQAADVATPCGIDRQYSKCSLVLASVPFDCQLNFIEAVTLTDAHLAWLSGLLMGMRCGVRRMGWRRLDWSCAVAIEAADYQYQDDPANGTSLRTG
jgi:hypothetical protein